MTRTNFLFDILSSVFDRREQRLKSSDRRSLKDLCAALLSERGEVSGSMVAAAILDRYQGLDKDDKIAFFKLLNDDYDVDVKALAETVSAYASERSADHLSRLLHQAEPPRQELLRRINRLPGATGLLVRMRADLLALMQDNPSLQRTDLDFQHLFVSWFNRGFLVLKRIDWNTPANILEKIIEYEAVHAIDDWSDLRRRLAPSDRRCFAFFHPAMPDEPLIFVEVALTQSVPDSVQGLLFEERRPIDDGEATTAVFYSISNCQKGLAGISFGNFLIKQVATDLRLSLPGLKTFLTLSPVPGFVRWLKAEIAASPERGLSLEKLEDGMNSSSPAAAKESAQQIRALTAEYLLTAKRGDGLPADPVARFHLGNGAQLEHVHAGADLSERGRSSSLGAMVNYLYDLRALEANHEAYAQHQTIAANRAVRSLIASTRKKSQSGRRELAKSSL